MILGVDASFLVQDRRGMGRYARSLLAAMVRGGAGHDIRFFIDRKRWQHREAVGEMILPWMVSQRKGAGMDIFPWEDRRRWDLDAAFFPWGRVDWDPPCPRVVTLHDVAPILFPPSGWLRAADAKADRRRIEQAAALADLVMTPSEFSRQELIRTLRLEPEQVRVVAAGVEPHFTPAPGLDGGSAAGHELAEGMAFLTRYTGGAPFVLFVGNAEARKNLERLLSAFRRLKETTALPHKLVLIGDVTALRTRRPRLIEASSDWRGGDVVMPGEVGDDLLVRAYRLADLFVFPSLYEGFGLPVLEAMACGAPVAAARAASIPEVAGDAAAYFPPEDEEAMAGVMIRLLTDRAEAARLAQRGLARARQFTWASAAVHTWSVLSEAVRRR